jgi:hypothetical protein
VHRTEQVVLFTRRKIWLLFYAAIVVFAALFVWSAGHRGIFLLDQSIMFDGAWRVFQGQIPYRDFYSAFPPVPFFILAFFFLLFGVDFSAMVIAAAVLNALAIVSVIYVVRVLLPRQAAMAAAGGLLTAVWFQAPFGTLWFEQTAFAFNLFSLVFALSSINNVTRSAVWLRISAGICLGIAMLCKQNAGAEFVPVVLAILVIPRLREPRTAFVTSAQVFAGLMLAAVIFGSWLWWFSSPIHFWHDYVAMARQIGADRFSSISSLLVLVIPIGTMGRSVLPLIAFCIALRATAEKRVFDNKALLICVVLGCVFYQNLFSSHTANEIENSMPYIGLIYALSIGMLLEGVREGFLATPITPVLVSMVLAVPLFDGALVSVGRRVQEFGPGTTFMDRVQVPGMSRVRWGEPTVIGSKSTSNPTILARQEFEALNDWLRKADTNFFVFKDSTVLYGLQHRISPQPWLYFSPGHGFLWEELPHVDAGVVESLVRNDVRVIVMEKESWLGDGDLWKKMPKLEAFLENDFEKVNEFGNYQVYRRRPSDSTP